MTFAFGPVRCPARMRQREAHERADVPAGRWMGRGLAVLGPAPGEEVTEAQLRNLFGEWGRHPHVDRIEADRLAAGDSAKKAFKAGTLGRREIVAAEACEELGPATEPPPSSQGASR